LKSNILTEEHTKFVNLSLASASRLDSTIQEILEYSRNSRMHVAHETFNIRELLQSIYDDLKFSTEKSVRLELNLTGRECVNSDRARLGVLLKNILGNSIKYSRASVDAFVKVDLVIGVNSLDIRIEDNGEGIPEKHVDKVFEMFYRATTTVAGTGLGLYICKEIVQKLNGKIELSSNFEDGTVVLIQIPLND
jgi:signal transduction histidine kinase